jgi:Fur family transcriptional regulator, ferric uptake regulator
MVRGAGSGRESASSRRNLEEAKRPLKAFLKAKGLHESKVRDLVVDTFLAADEHLDLAAILERVRRKNSAVGFATVYRTMRLLEEVGMAQSRDFGSGTTLYESCHGRAHHDHLVCERCGRIIEFVNEQIERLQEKVAEEHGFALRRHRLELFGLCERCHGAGS